MWELIVLFFIRFLLSGGREPAFTATASGGRGGVRGGSHRLSAPGNSSLASCLVVVWDPRALSGGSSSLSCGTFRSLAAAVLHWKKTFNGGRRQKSCACAGKPNTKQHQQQHKTPAAPLLPPETRTRFLPWLCLTPSESPSPLSGSPVECHGSRGVGLRLTYSK